MIKDPILLDFPMFITTERLNIRPMMPGDGPVLFEAIEESRFVLKEWLPWVNFATSVENCERTARQFYADFILRRSLPLVIFRKDHFIGGCGFNNIKWDIPSASIGYWCRVSEQGNGYIQEAIAAQTLYGFKTIGFKRLSILCDDENIKSKKVAEALNFHLETKAKGLLPSRKAEDPEASLQDVCHYVRFDSKGLENIKCMW
jgi:RimJ/RimL family protein N-acetyltransferase